MKALNKQWLGLVASAVVLQAGVVFDAAAQLPPVIKIGASAILSGPGASNGFTMQGVNNMLVKEINAAGGIAGRKVEIVYGDDQADPTQAVNVVKRLIDSEKVHVMVGPAIAQVSLAAAPELTRAKLFSLPFTGATSITPQVYPYGFATFYASDSFAMAMIDFAIDKMKVKAIAALVDTGAQGQAAGAVFKAYAEKRGMKLVALEAADFTSNDVTPQILNLRRAGADVIVQVSSTDLGATVAYKATSELGWNVPIISQVSSLFPAQILKAAGPDTYKGGRLIGLTLKASTICPGENPANSNYGKFIVRLKAANPDWQKFALPLATYFADGMYIIKAAIEGTQSVDGPKMAAWVEANASKIPTIGGQVKASKTDHILYGSDVFAFTKRPDLADASGLSIREGC